MRSKILPLVVFIVIGICFCLLPNGSEASPLQRHGIGGRCPPLCSIYCPCGNVLDGNNCPICRCRPSNICTGRHPNAHPRHRQSHSKSQILY